MRRLWIEKVNQQMWVDLRHLEQRTNVCKDKEQKNENAANVSTEKCC